MSASGFPDIAIIIPTFNERGNVTALLGHRVRNKTSRQIIAELDGLYARGWRDDVFFVSWLPRLRDLLELCEKLDDDALIDKPFNPRMPAQLASSEDIFSIIRRGDVLLHRPYDSFSAIVEFLHAAATDPFIRVGARRLGGRPRLHQ